MPILTLIIFWFFICLTALSAKAESNFDYFFKNSSEYQDVLVEKVLRADLVQLENGKRIRLIGLNAPQAPRNKVRPERDQYGFVAVEKPSPLTPIEELAFNYVQELLEGKHVRLEFDIENKDSDHHDFAYVFLLKDNVFVNAEILRQGYADLQIQPPNLKYADRLREAYREAHKERRGLQNK